MSHRWACEYCVAAIILSRVSRNVRATVCEVNQSQRIWSWTWTDEYRAYKRAERRAKGKGGKGGKGETVEKVERVEKGGNEE